ncbi:TonB-dependent receptor [Hyphomonas sp. WL0036]|uniref:TonB-dependent receptor n=1 Tax=Hyphomonas sediminis TaxID=2866160 RepID=UPI001C821CB4|nr:TonB-dependent receptor [Hyphomonas sediminis]MBY9068118.1 TonB-dependent receptor [Hyphomonas sediminis]
MSNEAARIAFGLAALAVLSAGVSVAQEKYEISIAPARAADAIKSLSFQTGHSVLFQTEDVGSIRTNAVKGQMTLREAMDALFKGTALTGGLTESGIMTISLAGGQNQDGLESDVTNMISKKTLMATVSAIVFGAAGAQAQEVDAAADEVKRQEVVVVVGSRIAGADVGGALPVTVVGAEEIEAIAAVSGEDLFRAIPQFGDVSFNQTSGQVSSNFARGDVGSVDLRNLGVGSTLVLINGRRGVSYPSSQASDTLAPVLTFNSNTVPVNGIKRVEVLRDGAGAIYGSDAVAGVVNMVLQDDFEGARIEAQYGGAPDTNLNELTLNGLFGKSFADGRGNITLFANYTDRSALLASDQEFSASGDLRPLFAGTQYAGSNALLNSSTTTPWGAFQTVGNVRVTQGGVSLTSAAGAFHVQPGTNAGCLAGLPNGICIDDASAAYTGGDINMRWDARKSYPIAISPDLERTNLFAMGKYELENGMELFGEAGFYRADTVSVQDSVFTIGSIRMTIPETNYWNPFGPTQFANGDPNPNRLPGIDAPAEGLPIVLTGLRFSDLGPTTVRVRAEQYRALTGLRGDFGGWDWETALLYSEAKVDDRQDGISASALQESLALSTPDAFNPFNGGDPLNPGSDNAFSSQAALDAITIEANRRNKTTLFQWDANISRPDLLQIWAGDVGLAAGLEYRRETQLDDRDRNVDGTVTWYDTVLGITQGSNLFGVSPTPDTSGSRNVASAYIELAVPLVSPEMNIPLVQALDLQLAGRFEDYSDFGSVAKPKAALSWDVIDGLRIRGAYSEGFRAPNLEQVNATIITRGNTRTDWVMCEADYRAGRIASFNDCNASVVATARRAGNPNLKPEESTNWTVGAVIQPQGLPDFAGNMTFTADFWSIEQTGIVGVFGEGNALIVDYLNRVQGTSNSNVVRLDPTADDIARFAGTGLTPVGQVQYVDDLYQNLQPQSVEGVDLGFIWNLDGTRIGDFDFSLNASRLLKYERGVSPDIQALIDARASDLINELTTLPEGEDLIEQNGNPKWRLSSSLTWSYNQFRVGANATYVSGVDDTSLSAGLGNYYRVDDHTLVNLYGQYSFEQDGLLANSRIRIGARNLFDKDPPLADETFGYMGSLYPATPRYLYVSVQKEF